MQSPGSSFVSRNTRQAITSRLRLRNHDYREPGAYFLTLCLQKGQCLLGSISGATISLTPAGTMAMSCWERIPERFATVDLAGFVIMPNHMHGIVILDTDNNGEIPGDAPSLSDVVQSFKQCTLRGYARGVKEQRWPRCNGKLWQRGYMDHVIRNDREWERLTRYIETNVERWEDDTFHPQRPHDAPESSAPPARRA